jgi:hypothetical protein
MSYGKKFSRRMKAKCLFRANDGRRGASDSCHSLSPQRPFIQSGRKQHCLLPKMSCVTAFGRCTAALEGAIGSRPVLDCEIWTQDGHAQIVVEFEGTPRDLLHNLLHKWLHTILKISIYTEH